MSVRRERGLGPSPIQYSLRGRHQEIAGQRDHPHGTASQFLSPGAEGALYRPDALGMGGWLQFAVQLQKGLTARQKPVTASERTNQVKIECKRHLEQSQLAGSALNRLGNPVVSYSPVRGSRDLVAARDT